MDLTIDDKLFQFSDGTSLSFALFDRGLGDVKLADGGSDYYHELTAEYTQVIAFHTAKTVILDFSRVDLNVKMQFAAGTTVGDYVNKLLGVFTVSRGRRNRFKRGDKVTALVGDHVFYEGLGRDDHIILGS